MAGKPEGERVRCRVRGYRYDKAANILKGVEASKKGQRSLTCTKCSRVHIYYKSESSGGPLVAARRARCVARMRERMLYV